MEKLAVSAAKRSHPLGLNVVHAMQFKRISTESHLGGAVFEDEKVSTRVDPRRAAAMEIADEAVAGMLSAAWTAAFLVPTARERVAKRSA